MSGPGGHSAGIEHEAGNAAASRVASDRALELAPDDARALLTSATLAIDTGDYRRARSLLAHMPEEIRADAVHCEAMMLYREGRHEEAIAKYTEAIELGPEDPHMVRWNRALPRHSIGDYAGGWADFEARADQTTTPGFGVACKRFHPSAVARRAAAGEAAPARRDGVRRHPGACPLRAASRRARLRRPARGARGAARTLPAQFPDGQGRAQGDRLPARPGNRAVRLPLPAAEPALRARDHRRNHTVERTLSRSLSGKGGALAASFAPFL